MRHTVRPISNSSFACNSFRVTVGFSLILCSNKLLCSCSGFYTTCTYTRPCLKLFQQLLLPLLVLLQAFRFSPMIGQSVLKGMPFSRAVTCQSSPCTGIVSLLDYSLPRHMFYTCMLRNMRNLTTRYGRNAGNHQGPVV